MSLVNILSEIKKNLPLAEAIVDNEPGTTYRGRVGLKKAAIETVSRLKNDYRKELLSSTFFIVVTGPAQEQFAQLASNPAFECFCSDPESLYKELASKVEPTLYGREGTRHLFGIASNALYDKAMELNIDSHNMLQFSEKYNMGVKNANDFASLLKAAMNDQVGSEIVGLNAVYSLVDKAIENGHSARVTPVLLNTPDEKFALDLLQNLGRLKTKTFLVVAGKPSKTLNVKDAVVVKNVNEESVGEALAAIGGKL